VLMLLTIQLEAFLVIFVSHAILHFCAEHHLAALHEVRHHVFELRQQGLLVHQVKVYFLFVCYLNPDVAFNEVHRVTFLIQRVVLLPFPEIYIFIVHLFEEQHNLATLGDQDLVFKQVSLPEVSLSDLLHRVLCDVLAVYVEHLALSINSVNFVLVRVIKRLEHKVFCWRVENVANYFARNSSFLHIVNKVLVRQLFVVKQRDEEIVTG
jgi:hypothetical protein